MKNLKKALIAGTCSVLLVAGSVAGTMAYLTSTDEVVNTFTVGDVQLKLDEAKVNLDGTYVTNHENRTETTATGEADGNKYKLMPGHTYIKDPTVTLLQGSERSYVRMLVTITDIADVKKVFGDNFLPENFVKGWDSTLWVPTKITPNNDNSVTYEFRYFAPVDALTADLTLDDLFEEFTIPGEIKDLTSVKEMQVKVVAHAIQADGFANADAAWTAFDSQK